VPQTNFLLSRERRPIHAQRSAGDERCARKRPKPHHDLRSEERRHLYHRVSHLRRRAAGGQRAGWRDPRTQAFPGAPAYSSISRSVCLMGCLCRTFREEPLAHSVSLRSGALVTIVRPHLRVPETPPALAHLGRGSRFATMRGFASGVPPPPPAEKATARQEHEFAIKTDGNELLWTTEATL